MSHPYLATYEPPIPTVQIFLGYPEEGLKYGPFTAIIDTGADGTLIPQSLLDTVNAPVIDDVRIRSHWGEWRGLQLFAVDIGLDTIRLPAVDVVGDDQGDEIILGRNFLNKLNLLLRGPSGLVEVLDR